MVIPERTNLTLGIANRFLLDQKINLRMFTHIDEDAAERLSTFKEHWYLDLRGLVSISDSAALSLSKYFGGLKFGNLTCLSDSIGHIAVARKLVGGDDDDELFLNKLTSLSPECAENLNSGMLLKLFLNGLTVLSAATAAGLAKHEVSLYLNGLLHLTDDAAESLSRHLCGLSFDGLTDLSDTAALFLGRQRGYHVDGVIQRDDGRPTRGTRYAFGSLSLNGLTSLTDVAVERLSQYQGDLSLNGLTSLSDFAAKSLSMHDSRPPGHDDEEEDDDPWYLFGRLELKGVRHLSPAAAEWLSKYKGALIIKLENWPTDAAEVYRSACRIS